MMHRESIQKYLKPNFRVIANGIFERLWQTFSRNFCRQKSQVGLLQFAYICPSPSVAQRHIFNATSIICEGSDSGSHVLLCRPEVHKVGRNLRQISNLVTTTWLSRQLLIQRLAKMQLAVQSVLLAAWWLLMAASIPAVPSASVI
jgi:hypothetical protein